MDGRKRRANYMKQGGLKMYAPWVIWLIAFVKMIYLYAQIGQKGITFYAAALFTILFIYVQSFRMYWAEWSIFRRAGTAAKTHTDCITQL